MENLNNWILYCHINIINRKKYIGITSKQDPNSRWRNGRGYANSPYFYHAIQKYGWDNFKHAILLSNLTKEEACFLEKYFIKELKLQNPEFGYNFSDGGNEGNSMKKERHPMYGKHHTNEAKEKNRLAHLGKTFSLSEEAKEKIRLSALGNHRGKHTKVQCVETGIVYESAAEAGRQTGTDASAIIKCINGKLRKSNNLHWVSPIINNA